MAIARLGETIAFPDPESAHPSGAVAFGGDLSVERLLVAYSMGIFPWPSGPRQLWWHAPAERFVVAPGQVHINRTLRKVLAKHPYRISLDTCFQRVMEACANTPRPGQDGTWILPEMVTSYTQLHHMGLAHSVEAWQGDELVGGLYGVALGRGFNGESMFSHADNASKVAFVTLAEQLRRWGFYFIDAQVHTPLLESLGGAAIPRRSFTQLVQAAVAQSGVPGPWQLDADLRQGRGP